ncbi:MAG: hypothetical protein QW660_05635 [Candidatus Bathyarchaeia archaeon]
MARKFSALLLVMSIVTLVWLVWLVYALSEPHPVLYAYNAILYEGSPDEWYKPEQLDLVLTPINSTLLYCCAPSPSLHGYIIRYNGTFYQICEPIVHVDYGPFGPNDFLKKTVPPTIAVGFGWFVTVFVFKTEKGKRENSCAT